MKKNLLALLILTLLPTSVFAKETSDWAKGDYVQSGGRGLVPLSIATSNLTENITRKEFVTLAMTMLDTMKTEEKTKEKSPFTDCDDDFVLRAYSLGIISGKTKTEFFPNDNITRQEIAKVLINTLSVANKNLQISTQDMNKLNAFEDKDVISDWAKEDIVIALKYGLLSGVSSKSIAPLDNATREQSIAIIARSVNKYNRTLKNYKIPQITAPQSNEKSKKVTVKWDYKTKNSGYTVIIKDENGDLVTQKSVTSKYAEFSDELFEYAKNYTITVSSNVDGKTILSESVKFQYIAQKEFSGSTSFLDLKQKYQRVFPNGIAFETEEDAKTHMVVIKVPCWKLQDDGSKVSTGLYVEVNEALKDEVVAIFEEIYNSEEKFPIKDVGGYCWRNSAVGRISEHSYGTCIDINWDENYYCYKETGEAITGSFWKPYENPYSILEDGIVVKTFAKYGWAWGGNAWTRLCDYMHFTYLGN